MKKIINYFRQSITRWLSLWIVLFAAIIFILALSFMFFQSREAVHQEAVNRATKILDNTTLRVTNILDRVETATTMTEWLVMRHPDVADSMFVYSKGILKNNPDFHSCSISFEPYYFQDKGLYFSAYAAREGDDITLEQEGNDQYQYFYYDWYLLPKLLDRPTWTEPYMDYGYETSDKAEMLISYCRPLKDKQGKLIGVISTDLQLNWLSQTISAVKPYPNSYSVMIGKGGTYFVHPDSTKLLNQTVFTETLEKTDTALLALGHAMQNGQEGMKQMYIDGQDSYVFYKPLGNTGWSMAIVCPESDIFKGYHRLYKTIIAIVIIGLLLMFYFFSSIITKELKPLKMLSRQAETVASGNFKEELPEPKRPDEIGKLTQSFSDMQHSLVNYIDELTRTTANKERIESELHIARDIQMSMIPRIFPPFPNREDIDLYGIMTPAKEVGGDLYDFFILHEKLYFCLGDVSGKGIPASLFMAVTRNLFRIVAQQEFAPEEIAHQLNALLSKDNDRLMFVTMFIGVIDLKTGRLNFCNCGHNPPVIDGKFIEMSPNSPLGILEDNVFKGEYIDNVIGKQILVYTDGLNEAENANYQLFGDERVLEIMQQAQNMKARQIIEKLCKEVEAHRSGVEPNDDLTMLCLKLLK